MSRLDGEIRAEYRIAIFRPLEKMAVRDAVVERASGQCGSTGIKVRCVDPTAICVSLLGDGAYNQRAICIKRL